RSHSASERSLGYRGGMPYSVCHATPAIHRFLAARRPLPSGMGRKRRPLVLCYKWLQNALGRGIIVLLPPSGRRVGVHTQQRKDVEPIDNPVRLYDIGLCAAAQLLTFAAQSTHSRAVELAAAASLVLLIALSLWTLLVPPRYSATRVAFVFVGLLCL